MVNARIITASLVAFCFGMFLTACAGKKEDAIIGTWTIDLEASMAEDPKFKDMPEDQKKQAMEAAKAFMGTMSFEFTKDGQAIAKMGEKEEKGTYTVKKVEGDTLTIEMKQGEGDKAKAEEMTVTVKDGKLIMAQGKQKFVLKKK